MEPVSKYSVCGHLLGAFGRFLRFLSRAVCVRAASTMFPDMPLLKSDLGLAAAALLAFTRTMQPDDKLNMGE